VIKIDAITYDKIEMMFNFMEYDFLSDAQHDLILSLEDYYTRTGKFSDAQFELLSDIFKQAAEK